MNIQRNIGILCAVCLLFSSCGTSQMGSASPQAVMTGATVGGQVGNAIGGLIGDSGHGPRGAFRGSAIGTIVGTLAGAAIGGAVSSAQQKERMMTPVETSSAQNFDADIDALRIKNIRFIDDGRDRILNPEENSKVIFEIVNEGKRTARNVVPTVSETSGAKHIYISPSVLVEQIKPGEGIKYTATVSAGRKVKNGEITLHLAILDEFGTSYDWHEFTIQTERK